MMRKALEAKGFRPFETHHTFYILYVDGKKTSIRTMISHGISEYGDALLGHVRRQLGLTSKELQDLVECPLSGESYVALLKERGKIKP
jgi:hypothetical protein